jgi:hypothetical protein
MRYASGRTRDYLVSRVLAENERRLTSMKDGILASTILLTSVCTNGCMIGWIDWLAFLNKWVIQSPTKMAPDSEKLGSRNRANRDKVWSMPVRPSGPVLETQP